MKNSVAGLLFLIGSLGFVLFGFIQSIVFFNSGASRIENGHDWLRFFLGIVNWVIIPGALSVWCLVRSARAFLGHRVDPDR